MPEKGKSEQDFPFSGAAPSARVYPLRSNAKGDSRPLSRSPHADLEVGSDLDFPGVPRQNNTMRSPATANGVRSTSWCCFSFPNRRTHGGSLIWFKREFPVCCEHSQQKRHPKTGCRFLASVIPISKRTAAGFFRRRRRKKPVPCCFAVPHGLRGENLLAFRHYRIIIDAGKVPIYNQ